MALPERVKYLEPRLVTTLGDLRRLTAHLPDATPLKITREGELSRVGVMIPEIGYLQDRTILIY